MYKKSAISYEDICEYFKDAQQFTCKIENYIYFNGWKNFVFDGKFREQNGEVEVFYLGNPASNKYESAPYEYLGGEILYAGNCHFVHRMPSEDFYSLKGLTVGNEA